MSPSLTAEARFVARERLLRRLILEAGREHPRVSFTLRGVRVIPDYRTGVTPGHVDVHVDEGVIADILPAAGPPSGEWVVGGLVDSHVRTHGSERQTILHLINGVTGVREMCGFDWMPERRERIASGLELGPRMFVAGHILASHPMDGFATVVESVGDVWREVEAQRAAGFEAIKVHNRLDLERYDAAASAAKANGLPLVGHVPHGVPVEHALASGQTTIEHLKGFYQDWDLQLGQGDWAEATRLSSTWNCPTLVLARVALTGPEAKAVIESARGLWDPMPACRSAPRRRRSEVRRLHAQEPDRGRGRWEASEQGGPVRPAATYGRDRRPTARRRRGRRPVVGRLG